MVSLRDRLGTSVWVGAIHCLRLSEGTTSSVRLWLVAESKGDERSEGPIRKLPS